MTKQKKEGVSVITGGASGIGEACARELSARGQNVVIADINPRGAEVAKSIGVYFYSLDVTEDKNVGACAAAIEKDLGPVKHLVNCAGVLQQPLSPEALPMDIWDGVVNVVQRGTYLSSVTFAKHMMERKEGTITNIASITANRSVPLHSYAPAKAAVVAITECLAAEWGPYGIRVNAVSPGHTLTPALEHAIKSGKRDPVLLSQNALGRMVEADEVAKAVAFLISDDAAAITGVNLPVDCGWLVSTSWTTYGGLRKHNES
jgi:NAD(P)-dependent dehydrogenase (short-subunit alcohol dehydrogenase family)